MMDGASKPAVGAIYRAEMRYMMDACECTSRFAFSDVAVKMGHRGNDGP
jgi:hypothetical protein